MDFKHYQNQAKQTAIYKDKLVYPALGLMGEAGEVANKIKKILRDNQGNLSQEIRSSILQELGDVLWYISAICTDLDAEMEDIAQKNIEKLFARKEKNTITGSGDNR